MVQMERFCNRMRQDRKSVLSTREGEGEGGGVSKENQYEVCIGSQHHKQFYQEVSAIVSISWTR